MIAKFSDIRRSKQQPYTSITIQRLLSRHKCSSDFPKSPPKHRVHKTQVKSESSQNPMQMNTNEATDPKFNDLDGLSLNSQSQKSK